MTEIGEVQGYHWDDGIDQNYDYNTFSRKKDYCAWNGHENA